MEIVEGFVGWCEICMFFLVKFGKGKNMIYHNEIKIKIKDIIHNRISHLHFSSNDEIGFLPISSSRKVSNLYINSEILDVPLILDHPNPNFSKFFNFKTDKQSWSNLVRFICFNLLFHMKKLN